MFHCRATYSNTQRPPQLSEAAAANSQEQTLHHNSREAIKLERIVFR
jgi:hypothetical protein